MKYLKLGIQSAGAEYTFGGITDEEDQAAINLAIENEEDIGSSYSYVDKDGDDVEVNGFDNTELLQIYGPSICDIDRATVTLEVYEDEDFSDYVEDIDLSEEEVSKITLFSSSNPDPYDSDFLEKFDDGDLLFATQKVEKRIVYPLLLTLADDVDFDTACVFVGTMNMDETFNGDEIAEVAYYIPKDDQEKLLKKFFGESDDPGTITFGDILPEIYPSNPDWLEAFKCEIGDIEGKGENENDYVKILNLENEEIYTNGDEY